MLRERAASAWVGNGAEGMGTCALERQWQKREIQMVRDYNIQYTGFYGAHKLHGRADIRWRCHLQRSWFTSSYATPRTTWCVYCLRRSTHILVHVEDLAYTITAQWPVR